MGIIGGMYFNLKRYFKNRPYFLCGDDLLICHGSWVLENMFILLSPKNASPKRMAPIVQKLLPNLKKKKKRWSVFIKNLCFSTRSPSRVVESKILDRLVCIKTIEKLDGKSISNFSLYVVVPRVFWRSRQNPTQESPYPLYNCRSLQLSMVEAIISQNCQNKVRLTSMLFLFVIVRTFCNGVG